MVHILTIWTDCLKWVFMFRKKFKDESGEFTLLIYIFSRALVKACIYEFDEEKLCLMNL